MQFQHHSLAVSAETTLQCLANQSPLDHAVLFHFVRPTSSRPTSSAELIPHIGEILSCGLSELCSYCLKLLFRSLSLLLKGTTVNTFTAVFLLIWSSPVCLFLLQNIVPPIYNHMSTNNGQIPSLIDRKSRPNSGSSSTQLGYQLQTDTVQACLDTIDEHRREIITMSQATI